MRKMRKSLKIAAISVGALLFIMVTLPFLFKDKIRGVIHDQIQKKINGQVWYDAESFSISLFRHFPNLSVSVSDIGLVSNVSGFKGDTLFAANEFNVAMDIMSVISDNEIKVTAIILDKPKILTVFDKTGKSSWDVFYPDTTKSSPQEPSQPSTMKIAIEKWEITDATIIYDDQSMPMYARLNHFNHSGSGDFGSDIVNLKTRTSSSDVFVDYDGTSYLNHCTVSAEATMKIDLAKSIYTFMDNEFAINDFKFGFNGSIEMPDSNIIMDITYKANETAFKNILSLVPGIYTKDYDKLKTEGTMGFDGFVKGTYNNSTMPGFGLNMFIKNGFFQYPDLPESVKNVNMDLLVENKDGIMDHTILNLKQFHMDMGKNPMDASLLMNGMNPYDLDAKVSATLKLEEIEKFYPIKGTTLKGLFGMDVKAKGKYSDSLKLMPMVNAKMSLANGFVKSSEFPEPIQDINLSAVANSDGNMQTSTFLLDYFKLILDGETFEINAFVKNFDDPNYQATIKGIIDFAKMTKIYPLEGTTLTGRMTSDITTKGILSEVQAGNYRNTQSSGTMAITDMIYKSVDLPQGFTMKTGTMIMAPDRFTITNMNGFIGKSDYTMNGFVSNYMGYMFGGNDTIIHGTINFASKRFDVNEWMSDDSAPAPVQTSPTAPAVEPAMQAYEVPRNLDIIFNADMKEVLYSNMAMTDMTGSIITKNGIVNMNNLVFNSLGGNFLVNGKYNTQDIKKPSFDMNMNIKNLAVKEAYKTFGTIKKLAPIANYVEGNMNMTVMMNGLLGQDMMPVYATLNGSGSLGMASAKILSNPILGSISSVTKFQNIDPLEMKGVKINFTIQNGALVIAPFNIESGKTKIAVLKGLNKSDGSIDYDMQLNTPSGALGAAASNALSGLVGKNVSMPSTIIIDLNVSGPYDKTKIKILKTNFGEVNQTAVKDAAIDKIKNSDQAKQIQQQADQVKQQAEDELKKQQDAAQQQLDKERQALEQKTKQAEDSAKKKAVDGLKKAFPKF